MEVAASNQFNRPPFDHPLSRDDATPSTWDADISIASASSSSVTLLESSSANNSNGPKSPDYAWRTDSSLHNIQSATTAASLPSPVTVVECRSSTAPSLPAYDSSPIGEGPENDSGLNGVAAERSACISPSSNEAASGAKPVIDASSPPPGKGLSDGSSSPHLQGSGSLPMPSSSGSEKQVTENAKSNTPLERSACFDGRSQQQSAFHGPTSATGSHNSFPNHNTQTQKISGHESQIHNYDSIPSQHNYWGRREHVQYYRGDQDWNINTSFNGRDMHMPPRGVPRFARPSPPPYASAQYSYCRPSQLPPYRGTYGFSGELGPHFPYYAAPAPAPPPPPVSPPVSFSHPVPYTPPIRPFPMNVTAPDPELRAKILKQIEYYFSFDNLIKDIYLRKQMDDQGWVSIRLIAGFPKMRKLTNNIQMIMDALQTSSAVEILGDKIRRRDEWERWIIPDSCQLPSYQTSSKGKARQAIGGRSSS